MFIRSSIEGEEKTQQIKLQGRSQKKIMIKEMPMVNFFSYLFRVLMMTDTVKQHWDNTLKISDASASVCLILATAL